LRSGSEGPVIAWAGGLIYAPGMSTVIAAHRKILLDLLSLPTAPFHEQRVARYVTGFCERRGLKVRADRFGNLLTCYRKGTRRPARPLALSAHLDHPGFEALGRAGAGRVRARWRGGVALEYFKGSRVRFWTGRRWVRGTITSVKPLKSKPGRMRRADTVEVELRGGGEVPAGSLGMWDLPQPTIRGRRVRGIACDDMGGVAGILCMLEVLCRRRAGAVVYGLFTRAEEVGFAGCLSACEAGSLPKRCAVVGIECSKELPTARLGDGPILRVGDRMSVFSPALGEYCRSVADELARKKKGFRYQRKLMDGGSCESTAYCAYGYEAAGICLALGNYHNMDQARRRIDREYIHLEDFANMVEWFVALATCRRPFGPKPGGPPNKTLQSLRRKYEPTLIKTA